MDEKKLTENVIKDNRRLDSFWVWRHHNKKMDKKFKKYENRNQAGKQGDTIVFGQEFK